MEGKASKFEIDIEIKDLLWEFLRKWRLIVVLAVICGVGLTAYQYRMDMSKTDVVTVKKTQEELETSMSKQDIGEVSGAVSLHRQLQEKGTYMDDSVLMNVNPYEENAVFLQYYIGGEAYEGVAEDATEAYVAFVENDSLAQAVSVRRNGELAFMYMAELINLAGDDGNVYVNASNTNQSIHLSVQESGQKQTFSVKVIGQSEEEARMIAADVKAIMESYSQTVMGMVGTHQLQLVDESSNVVVDQSLAELQNRNAAAVKTLANNLDSMKNEMTSDQISLYVYRTTVTVEQPTATEGTTVTSTAPKAQISIKHTIIGAVVGAVLACVLICVLYLFAATLRNGEEVKNLYKVKILGYVDDSAFQKKKLFGFVDKWIVKLQNIRKKKLSYEQEIQMIAANVALDCKKKECTEVFFGSSTMESIPEEVVNAIVKKCEEKGLHIVTGAELAYDAEALVAASNADGVVFIEKEYASLYDELYKEVALCKEHGMNVIGMIILG